MTNKLLAKIREVARMREFEAATTFEGLADQIANGAEPSYDEAQSILTAAGRTVDDLQQAVELRQKRQQALEHIAKADQANARRRGLQHEREAEVERFAKLREKHAAKMESLRQEGVTLGCSIARGRDGERFIHETSEPTEQELALRDELTAIDDELRQIEWETNSASRLSDEALERRKERAEELQERRQELIAEASRLDREKLAAGC